MVNADSAAGPRAPETIEREMEVTRERLAGTIDQLLYRSSPKTIAKREFAELKAFFVDPQRGPRVDNIAKVAAGVAGFVGLMLLARKVSK